MQYKQSAVLRELLPSAYQSFNNCLIIVCNLVYVDYTFISGCMIIEWPVFDMMHHDFQAG